MVRLLLIFSILIFTACEQEYVRISHSNEGINYKYAYNESNQFVKVTVKEWPSDSIFTIYLTPQQSMFIGNHVYKILDQDVDPNKTASYLHMQKLEAERIQREQEYQREIDSLSNAIGHIEGFDVKEFFEGLDREIKKQREKNGSKN